MMKKASLEQPLPEGSDLVVPAAPAGARRLALHRLIAERGFVSVAEVAKEIGISDMTVRRDLEALERDGLVQRSHGGAVPVLASAAAVIQTEPSYAARAQINPDAKRRIASAAAGLILPYQAIGLDAGSTAAYLAAELADRQALEIVTNSLQTILAMPQPIIPEVYLLGGRLRPREGSMCGSITRQQLSGHWLDRFFLGICGIDENGVYDYSPEDTETKTIFMQQSKIVTALCDSSKFGKRSFVRICGFDALHSIVTDAPLPPEIDAAARAAGVEIILAQADAEAA
ncbi:DeoR/GlpR transcriptional regulator [Acidisoma cellulosilytica]|uniref:DeoR/GlpR transcriptional regulator n=1 Tax=Acidisoma cellulosilyticum TaxID=2802395 RepID=A0A963YXD0_9PROT|nr:DeoR/GlpR family DNA-binding transcription regulator [Acidisoma cellulosilyticum]MCB8878650.1 DeoR/GlpR transcriptional regulator [Acidisoma cellulosilyticum]